MAIAAATLQEVQRHYGVVKNYIGGEWVESDSDQLLEVRNPATAEAIAQVPLSTPEEVDAAARAAREAFLEWRETPPVTRARYMFRLKAILEEHFEELARIVVQEQGKTIDEARGSVRRAIENVEVATGVTSLMMGYNLEDGAAANIDEEVVRQPIGTFAAICPFNFPAMVPFWFWPYAVATGNTYIVKPSEQVPLTQQRMFELIHEAGFPPGVLNLVNGAKQTVDAILTHPDVNGVSFVGSTPVAKHVYQTASAHGKRVQAQGGAKNALVVMPDAVLDKTIPNMLSSFFGAAGQRCLAGSVLVTVGEVHHRLVPKFVEAASKIKLGYGLDETAQMGPVISQKSRDRIHAYIQKGLDEGAKLLLDGRDAKVSGYEHGYFVGPTVFDGVMPDMAIAQDEIFGPVVATLHVDSLDDAIEVIHRSPYGNAASLYTQSGKAARDFRYRVQCGNIGINIGIVAAMAYFPFSGMKESFFGALHGQGKDAINFFTESKVVITRWF